MRRVRCRDNWLVGERRSALSWSPRWGGWLLVLAFALLPVASIAEVARGQAARSAPQTIPVPLEEAVQMVFADFRVVEELRYVMTGKLRLLFFWVGKDDVGGGYIRHERGVQRPELEAIRLKIGSDPDKAPRHINRWGAGAEVVERDPGTGDVVTSAFFGFMKATKGESVGAVSEELRAEGEQQRFVFEASINHIGRTSALSSVLPIVSPVDFHIRQLDEAEQMVLKQYEQAFAISRYRELDSDVRGRCDRTESFLFTVRTIVDAAVAGRRAPIAHCLVYNSKPYLLTLENVEIVEDTTVRYELASGDEVEHPYEDLLELRFELENQQTGWNDDFELLVGTRGALRGVPVRIVYQPNFWFEVELHLHDRVAPGQRTDADGFGGWRPYSGVALPAGR